MEIRPQLHVLYEYAFSTNIPGLYPPDAGTEKLEAQDLHLTLERMCKLGWFVVWQRYRRLLRQEWLSRVCRTKGSIVTVFFSNSL